MIRGISPFSVYKLKYSQCWRAVFLCLLLYVVLIVFRVAVITGATTCNDIFSDIAQYGAAFWYIIGNFS